MLAPGSLLPLPPLLDDLGRVVPPGVAWLLAAGGWLRLAPRPRAPPLGRAPVPAAGASLRRWLPPCRCKLTSGCGFCSSTSSSWQPDTLKPLVRGSGLVLFCTVPRWLVLCLLLFGCLFLLCCCFVLCRVLLFLRLCFCVCLLFCVCFCLLVPSAFCWLCLFCDVCVLCLLGAPPHCAQCGAQAGSLWFLHNKSHSVMLAAGSLFKTSILRCWLLDPD